MGPCNLILPFCLITNWVERKKAFYKRENISLSVKKAISMNDYDRSKAIKVGTLRFVLDKSSMIKNVLVGHIFDVSHRDDVSHNQRSQLLSLQIIVRHIIR